MTDKRKGIERRKNLRRNAEDMVKRFAPKPTAEAMEILMHELMVHRVEIEMQNEELQSSQNLIVESRDRYVDLYEFSPVTYLTLSREGLIREINLTGCVMLGIERFRIMSRRLSSYVALHERDRWHRMFMNIMEHAEVQKQAFAMDMMRNDGTLFYAYFSCVKREKLESTFELHIALIDISELMLDTNYFFTKLNAPTKSNK